MNDQCGYIDARKIFSEVGDPRRDAIQCALGRGAGGDVPTELHYLVAEALAHRVNVVEVGEKLGEERQPVGGDRPLDSLENTRIYAGRIVRRLQQEG